MRQPSLWKRAVARVVAVTAGVAGSSLVAVMAVTDAARHDAPRPTGRNTSALSGVEPGRPLPPGGAMAIQRLNHAVLYVADVARSVAFYNKVLGFRTKVDLGRAAFLQAAGSTNDHDLGLFEMGAGAAPSQAGRSTVGLYHLAWEVDTLAELERIAGEVSKAGALVGATDHTTTKALYARDPDGLEFEVCWLVPADLLHTVDADAAMKPRPLDLAREIARYGADTKGGVGLSHATAGVALQ